MITDLLSQEEKNRRLANLCGWSGEQKDMLPMFFSDLNACAIVERTLTPFQCHRYNQALVRARNSPRPLTTSDTWTWGQPASVRAEQLGQILELW